MFRHHASDRGARSNGRIFVDSLARLRELPIVVRAADGVRVRPDVRFSHTRVPVPGYKTLPQDVAGPAAEQVRCAEALQRAGQFVEATHLLEVTLEDSTRCGGVPPGWLCGRLAALYRALKRYDDEVGLLERYREAQTSEDARTRFDARLSKARAIAERKRRTETYALASVRRVLRGEAPGGPCDVERLDGLSAHRMARIHPPSTGIDAPVM